MNDVLSSTHGRSTNGGSGHAGSAHAGYALDLPDAEIDYVPALPLERPPREILHRLIESVPWRSEEITVYGQRYLQPRLTAWFGDSDARYSYSGIVLDPLPWTELLTELRACVERAAGASFNSVLLNYYRDQHDRMGLHSDDEPELGTNPVIASLSIGAERTFVLRHKKRRDLRPVRLRLASGSLLVMKGETQHRWKHGIEKAHRPCGPRVNLTFRRILPGVSRSGRQGR
ncbi:MAG TPA: alpha-ketoglutarate-dependent dioxygenase AlkB [Gammaproteobacteria bacterium]|nr:alpha-ketoglutarate-dependent dioxygenase AlkB [Gammaproteobacteria bacterium]